MDNPAYPLPWRPISEHKPRLGGNPILVASGDTILFARFCYCWTLDHDVDTEKPMWAPMDGTMALDPQPTWYLPLMLPDGTPWPSDGDRLDRSF